MLHFILFAIYLFNLLQHFPVNAPISGTVTQKGLTTPLTRRVVSICYLCGGVVYIVLLGSPTSSITLVSSLREIPTVAVLHHPFLFGEKPTQCSRGSKKDFWRRCRGVYAKVSIPSTHHKTLSPALHYLPFASHFPLPHFTLAVLFALSFPIFSSLLLALSFARFVGIDAYLLLNREPKIYGSSST